MDRDTVPRNLLVVFLVTSARASRGPAHFHFALLRLVQHSNNVAAT
jgi:hypothetical protein